MIIDTGLVLIVLFVLAIVAYVHLGIGRQKAMWSQFAHRYGMRYEDQGFLRYPFVRGTVSGRSFELKVELVEMFTIRTGRSFMVMSLEIKGNFFCNMEIKKTDAFLELHYLNPGPRFLTGDQSFDAMSDIFCDDDKQCGSYLAPHRKNALRELFSREGESRLSITTRGAQVMFRSRRIIRDAHKLEDLFDTLLRVAPELDS
jgi:hypothetical protein